MFKGKVADISTHYELMRCGGLYERMFNAQAEWYKEEARPSLEK